MADFGLSAEGEEQARLAGEALRSAGIVAIVSSPLGRALQTARLIAEILGIDPAAITVDDDLRERDVGEWSGFTSDEIEQRWPGMLDQWRAGTLVSLPGGEGDITARVVPAVERAARGAPADGAVLIVAHGGVVTAAERALDVDPCRARNCCGRWIRWDSTHGRLIAEDAVVLVDPEAASETTAL